MFSPDQVARALGVEVETLGAWRRRGYGPRWYRIGKKIKYAEPDLRAWMSAQSGGGGSPHTPLTEGQAQ